MKIARRDLASGNEGQLVALATSVIQQPTRGDLGALEIAATKAKFKFTGYRLVLAFISILSTGNVRATTLGRIEEALRQIEQNTDANSDEPLQRLIDRARTTISALRDELA